MEKDQDFAFFDVFGDEEEVAAQPDEASTHGVSAERRAEPQQGKALHEWFPKAPPELRSPCVVGTIAVAELGVGVDLRELACCTRNVEFVPKKSSTATMRIRDPSCAVLIRNSGIMSVIGASSISAARQGAEIAARVVRHVLNLKSVRTVKFRIRSLMGRVDLRHPIRLDDLHRNHEDICSYEPESFCGCVVKLRGPVVNPWSVSCSVYVSGRVTLVGAKSPSELEEAFKALIPIIGPFSKK